MPMLLIRPPIDEKAPACRSMVWAVGIAGAIQRVVAAAVVDRQRGRLSIVAEIEDRSCGVVEAIDGVAGPGRGGAINRLDRVDVRHLRRDDIAVRAAE